MRKQNGYALVTTIVIGFVAIGFLVTLAGIVTSSVRVLSANKYSESLRNAAEIGIEYAVSQYNSQSPCPLDPVGSTASLQTTLPSNSPYLVSANATSGSPNVTVTITVSKLVNPSDWETSPPSVTQPTFSSISSIYSPELDPNRTVGSFKNLSSTGLLSPTSNLTVSGGGYRIISSVATNGIYSRAITTVLKARFDLPPDGTQPLLPSGTTPQNLFNSPMFSNGALTLASSSLTIEGYNSQTLQPNPIHTMTLPNGTTYNAYDLNVTTNSFAAIGTGNTISGDLTVSSNGSGSATVAQVSGGPTQGTVDGRLSANGVISAQATAGVQPTSGDNVLANADQVNQGLPAPSRVGLNQTNPDIVNTPAAAQTLSAPVPSSASTQPFGSLSGLVQQPDGSFSVQGATVSTGAYSTANLSTVGMTTSSPAVIQDSSAPVTFYVQGASFPSPSGNASLPAGTPSGVYLDTQYLSTQNTAGGATGLGRNLQIYYSGTDAVTVNISGGNNFSGLIYAPNAPVLISGTGNFYGGVVGGSVRATLTGTMYMYTDLSVTSSKAPPGWTSPMTGAGTALTANQNAGLSYQLGPNGSVIQGWQPVTWQESNPLASP